MNEYFLRFLPTDLPEVQTLGVMLGVGVMCEGTFVADGWVLFPLLEKPTGKILETPLGPTPEREIIKNSEGIPYMHANLRLRFDLGQKARELQTDNPELAVALQNLGKYFIVDGEGKPCRPASPLTAFSGD